MARSKAEASRVAVLGGGVSGVTTALLLNLLGYRTRLYAPLRADEAPPEAVPEFASRYPAASVIPHAIGVPDVAWHTRVTQRFFAAFAAHDPAAGVRWQRHYEVFERPVEALPLYAGGMRNFRRLPEDGRGGPGVPRRPEAEGIYGWSFDCLFAETPRYMARLFALYRQTGGTVERRAIRPEGLPALEVDAVVNCTGRWAPTLFEDDCPFVMLRGLLVHACVPQGVPMPPSYNYAPPRAVFPAGEGVTNDLYVYPRTDAWVLGGTRQVGRPALGEAWEGGTYQGRTVRVDGHDVPAPIVEENAALLRPLTGVDVARCPLKVVVGYRFQRDLKGAGVRLDVSTEHGVPVAHNYGHGGGGVALSWSCALRVAQNLRRVVGLTPDVPSVPSPEGASSGAVLHALRHAASEYAADHAAAGAVTS